MNTASLELSQELYELTGWGVLETDKCWVFHGADYRLKNWPKGKLGFLKFPAYDLGYLLRKLPSVSHMTCWQDNKYDGPGFQMFFTTKRNAVRPELEERIHTNAGTPEDAACKLAIELIKQGILKI